MRFSELSSSQKRSPSLRYSSTPLQQSALRIAASLLTSGESNRPPTPILLKRIVIHLPFLLRYFEKLRPFLGRKRHTPPICKLHHDTDLMCIAMLLQKYHGRESLAHQHSQWHDSVSIDDFFTGCFAYKLPESRVNCFGAPSPRFFKPNIRMRKPNTLTILNLPTEEMSEIDAKLTLRDAKRR